MMHLLWSRYGRPGYAPSWLYALIAAMCGAVVVWMAVRGEWVVAVVPAMACAALVLMLWRRYGQSSGYAAPWFYALLASAFVSLTVLAAIRGDWLLTVLAAVMIVVTVAGSRAMRRLNEAAQASQRAVDEGKDDDDG